MGQRKLRQDNNCLNCEARVQIRYCPVCGQENTELKESFASLIGHFISDVVHFDGKFFATSGYLFAKPGFLSAEYMAGRRARYIHPIRMYVFTSAIFFLLFFSLFLKQILLAQPAAPEFGVSKEMVNKFIHNFPYLLIISLPLNALFLKMLYFKRRQYYYADHAVFLIHLYVFAFLLLFLLMLIFLLNKYIGFPWMNVVYLLALIYGLWYAYSSMLFFYGQPKGKTLLKFTLFNVLCMISLLLLFALFFYITLIQL